MANAISGVGSGGCLPACGATQASTPSQTPCGVPAPAATRPSPSLSQDSFVAAASAAASPAATPARTSSPFDALRLLRRGNVAVELPLQAGPLEGGELSAKPGTVLRLHAVVEAGKISTSQSRVEFAPPLQLEKAGPLNVGFLGLQIDGAHLDSSGHVQATVEPHGLTGFLKPLLPSFDVQLPGVKLPLDMEGLAAMLEGGQGGLAASGKASPASPVPGVDLQGARLHAEDVELGAGTIGLGRAGALALGPGSRFDVDGTLQDLRLTGHAEIAKLNLSEGGMELHGAGGRGDVAVHLTQDAQQRTTVQTTLRNLDLHIRSAVARSPNGDFVSLGRGRVQNGQLQLEESFKQGPGLSLQDVRTKLGSLSLGRFSGRVEAARLTVPDHGGNAQLDVGPSTLAGSLRIDPRGIVFHGNVDARAAAARFDAGAGPVAVDVNQGSARARAHVDLDTRTGQLAVAQGEVHARARLDAGLDGSLPIVGEVHPRLGLGSPSVNLTEVNFSTNLNQPLLQLIGKLGSDLAAGWGVSEPSSSVEPGSKGA